jgi:hypothetical protein
MANGVNLYDLAAKISVDAVQADKALDSQQKKVQSLTKEYQKLDKSVSTTSKSVAKSIASVGDPLEELKQEFAQKFAVMREESEALAAKARALSADVQGFSASMAAAAGPATAFALGLAVNIAAVVGLHKVLLDLAVSTSKQAGEITSLAAKYMVSAETIQTAMILAAQSGKSIDQVLKENHNTLDATTEKYKKLGMVISNEMVAANNQLNKALVDLNFQWSVLEAQLGSTVIPYVTGLVRQFSEVLRDNHDVVNALGGAVNLLSAYLVGNLSSALTTATLGLGVLRAHLAPLISLMKWIQGGAQANSQRGGDGLKMLSDVARSEHLANQGLGRARAEDIFGPSVKKGGGGGAAPKEDPGLTLLKQLQNEFKDLTGRTELQATWEKILGKEYAKTGDEIKKKIYLQKADNIAMKEAIAENQKFVELIRELGAKGEEGFFRARYAGGPLIKDLERMVELVREVNAQRLRYAEITKNTRGRYAGTAPLGDDEWIDLGGGSMARRERPGGVAQSRGRVATAGEQALRDQMAAHREKMQILAADLTSILATSIHAGFDQGVKAGFQSLLDSLVQMIENVLLKRVQSGLESLLNDIFKSGGGIFGGQPGSSGSGIGAILGQIGMAGLGGAGGGFADGGFMQPNTWNVVGERGPELLHSGRTGGTVIPNHAMGGGITVNVYAQDARSFTSRDTQAQIVRQMMRMQQKMAMTG